MGQEIKSKAVILTNGTFLNGLIHIGTKQFGGGRMGDRASHGITENLKELGFESARLKTGTPVRVDGRSIDFSKLEEQPGDENPGKFSYTDTPTLTKQRSCYLAYTSPVVHDVLRLGFDDSPMYAGRIEGRGPRYCPSIEDKIDRFSGKSRHQLFVEPEGWETIEYYINGFSSSLPDHIQYKALTKISGFENARIFRPGYAIEYDYFPPYQLKYSLETRLIENLYFAGQINGTTGYEEAAAQGLMAGINAHLKLIEQDPLILKRSEAYIGVLIDDLITKGIDEPYRMFTSRAEYRILLRQDNADSRLTPLANKLGLASEERLMKVREKEAAMKELTKFIADLSVSPDQINGLLESSGTSPISQKVKLENVVLRPQVSLYDILKVLPSLAEQFSKLGSIKNEVLEEVEIQLKYQSYIDKESEIADRLSRVEDMPIKADFNYHALSSLSFEAREKLSRIKPSTLGQASRINGVSPADISVLVVFLAR
jgi:tRNA uridine 5-carboxymethylaminomethyl modification enzyme